LLFKAIPKEVNVYKTILVPLDGSKRAETILCHVENLAQCYQAKVIFLQVVKIHPSLVRHDGNYPVSEQPQLDQLTQEAETYLAARQEEFREKGIEARTVRTCVAYGSVVEAIINAAEGEGADLIAMASHGRTGLPQVFYGSVAAGVLHRVDRPLLLVRSLDRK
jgi:nucleotide-binding universal stress UspA family protein